MTRRIYFSDVLLRRRKRRVFITAAPPTVTYIPPRHKHRILPVIPPIIRHKRRLAPILPAAPPPAIVHIQSGANGGFSATQPLTNATTFSASFSSAVTSGNTVVGGFAYAPQSNLLETITVADDKGNSYTVVDAVHEGNGDMNVYTFYLTNITNAPTTITVTFPMVTSNHAFVSLSFDEFSGIATSAALDGHTVSTNTNISSGANGLSSGAIIPTTNGDLIYGVGVDTFSDNVLHGTGFTAGAGATFGGETPLQNEYLIQSTAASIAATFEADQFGAGDSGAAAVLAFKAATPPTVTYLPPRRKHRVLPVIPSIIRHKRKLVLITTAITVTYIPPRRKHRVLPVISPVTRHKRRTVAPSGIVTNTIGSGLGRDFATLALWVASLPTNLVNNGNSYIGLCYNDSEFNSATTLLTLTGHTTDPFHTITLKAAPGQSFQDNSPQIHALNYNQANGVGISCTGNTTTLSISDSNVTISGLQVQNTNVNTSAVGITATGANVNVNSCIVQSGRFATFTSTNSVTFRNCLLLGTDKTSAGTSTVLACSSGGFRAYFCTIVAPSDAATITNMLSVSSGIATIENCAIFGPYTTLISGAGTPTFTNCLTNQTNGFSVPVVTYANQFVNNTAAGGDYRPIFGADLLGAATPDSTNGAVDIVGTSRPQTTNWDVGAWEFIRPIYLAPRRKHRILPSISIFRRKRRLAPISTGTSTTYPLDQKGWVWGARAPVLTFSIASTGKAWVFNHQAPSLTFNVPAAQKDIVWNHQAPLLNFNIAAAQKSWTWNKQAPSLTFNIASTGKSWVWNKQAPTLQFNIAASQKHWLWNAQAPVDAFAIAASTKAWVWHAQAPNVNNGFTGVIWNWRANAPTLTAAIAATSQHWVWVHNSPTLTFTFAPPQKAVVWNKQAPTLQFAIALAQKAWVFAKNTYAVNTALVLTQKAFVWSAHAPALTLTMTTAQKAWRWAGNAPGIVFTLKQVQRAWRWIGQSPTMTGGNFSPKTNLHLSGGLPPRKRRSHPPE